VARPAGIITKADIDRAAAASEDLNNVRIRDLSLVSKKEHAMKAIAIDRPPGAAPQNRAARGTGGHRDGDL